MNQEVVMWTSLGTLAGSLITLVVRLIVSAVQINLKRKAEDRLSEHSAAETDTRLLTLFAELMDIAHCRRKTELSEKAVEVLLNNPSLVKTFTDLGFPKLIKDCDSPFRNFLSDACVVIHPVGLASSNSALCAIWILGIKHEVLRLPAIVGLKSMMSWRGELVKTFVEDLESIHSDNEQMKKQMELVKAIPEASFGIKQSHLEQ